MTDPKDLHVHPDNKFWNDRYSAHSSVYGEKPNEFFRRQLTGLTPGKILLPAEGEGRNSIYAAGLGWEVHAIDFSEVGREKTLEKARQLNLEVDYQLGDLATVQLPEEAYDVIALVFAHMSSDVRRSFHKRCLMALRPGGRIILEAYSKAQIRFNSGGPKDPDFLCTPEDLATDFTGLQIILKEVNEVTLNEGTFHQGPSSVVRLVGIK